MCGSGEDGEVMSRVFYHNKNISLRRTKGSLGSLKSGADRVAGPCDATKAVSPQVTESPRQHRGRPGTEHLTLPGTCRDPRGVIGLGLAPTT